MNGAEVIAEILKRESTEFLSCYPRNNTFALMPNSRDVRSLVVRD